MFVDTAVRHLWLPGQLSRPVLPNAFRRVEKLAEWCFLPGSAQGDVLTTVFSILANNFEIMKALVVIS